MTKLSENEHLAINVMEWELSSVFGSHIDGLSLEPELIYTDIKCIVKVKVSDWNPRENIEQCKELLDKYRHVSISKENNGLWLCWIRQPGEHWSDSGGQENLEDAIVNAVLAASGWKDGLEKE